MFFMYMTSCHDLMSFMYMTSCLTVGNTYIWHRIDSSRDRWEKYRNENQGECAHTCVCRITKCLNNSSIFERFSLKQTLLLFLTCFKHISMRFPILLKIVIGLSVKYSQHLIQLKLRLHTAINRADFVSWCMLYTYDGNEMHSWEKDAKSHFDQDTKSAQLIAVCKRIA